MLSLRFLSGRRRGEVEGGLKLPFSVGRSASDQVRVAEEGVWDGHLRLEVEEGRRVVAVPGSDGAVYRNGELAAAKVPVVNGDRFSLGAATFEVWLSSPGVLPLWRMEWLLWAFVGLVVAAEIFLVFCL